MRRGNLFALAVFATVGISFACSRGSRGGPVIRSGSVDVGGARLFYEDSGRGDALVLIHGGFLTKEMWDGQFERYAERYRVIRYDARNHGLSKTEAVTFAHFADLNRLMEHLRIPKAVIMGLSMGGYIAIDFALKHPEKVNGLILAAPGLSGYEAKDPETLAFEKKFADALASGDSGKITNSLLEAWTYGPRRKAEDVDPSVAAKVRSMVLKTLAVWNDKVQEAVASPLAVGRLQEIQAPTLAIVGDLDMPSILETVSLLEKHVPHFQKVVIPGVAHMLNLEKPREFDQAVLRFLGDVYGRTPR